MVVKHINSIVLPIRLNGAKVYMSQLIDSMNCTCECLLKEWYMILCASLPVPTPTRTPTDADLNPTSQLMQSHNVLYSYLFPRRSGSR